MNPEGVELRPGVEDEERETTDLHVCDLPNRPSGAGSAESLVLGLCGYSVRYILLRTLITKQLLSIKSRSV
jgi:hypothetical protein